MFPPFAHRLLHCTRPLRNTLWIRIQFQLVIHLLLMHSHLLTQLIHVADLLLPCLLLIPVQAVHQSLLFLLHLAQLVPDVNLLLRKLAVIHLLFRVSCHFAGLLGNVIRKLVAGPDLVPLLLGDFHALLFHLRVCLLASTLALAYSLMLPLPLALALPLAATATSAAFPLRERDRDHQQKYRKYN